MVNLIPEIFKKIWGKWNIRVVILLSLSLQTVLFVFAPLRKHTSSKLVIPVIWLAYLLADWVANFGVGLIIEIARDTTDPSTPGENNELLAFWVVFMLLHLGGPDTITAFSLEDNELWLRHLFGFVIQIVASVYIFLLTLPGNKLFIPTILVFIAGSIKYFERILALYLASVKKLQDLTASEFSELDRSDYAMEKYEDYLKVGCQYFKIFKGILVNLIPSFESGEEFDPPPFGDFKAEDALGIIEVELNLAYEVLHTKVMVTHSVVGIVLRLMCFGSVVAALSIFYFQIKKQGFHEFDVGVTHILFLGAIALDILSFFMLISSDWMFAALWDGEHETTLGKLKNRIASTLHWIIILKRPRWHSQHGRGDNEVLAAPFMLRRWSGSVSGFSWIRYMLKVRQSRGHKIKNCLHLACSKILHHLGFDRLSTAINSFICSSGIRKMMKAIDLFSLGDILYEIRIKTSLFHKPLTRELWLLIFDEIKRKASYADDAEANIKKIFSDRGNYTLQKFDTNGELQNILRESSKLCVHFDSCILLWHVVTELLYYTTGKDSSDDKAWNAREVSKIISDYMLYLLQSKPTLLNSSPTLAKTHFQRPCNNANIYLELLQTLSQNPEELVCEKIMEGAHGWKFSDERKMVNELQKLQDKKWEVLSKVWVEILSYAAIHCSTREHVKQVSNGGELFTFVWLLLHHFDLVKPHFGD